MIQDSNTLNQDKRKNNITNLNKREQSIAHAKKEKTGERTIFSIRKLVIEDTFDAMLHNNATKTSPNKLSHMWDRKTYDGLRTDFERSIRSASFLSK